MGCTLRDPGLVILGVHAPEFGFEQDLDNVRRATRELGISYPVVIDNAFAIWRSFENHYWPALYLVDHDGQISFHHFGEGAYAETERAVQQLLGVAEETTRIDAGGVAKSADWDTLRSPETYLGNARGGRRTDARTTELDLNAWALTGRWSTDDEAAAVEAGGAPLPTVSEPATSTWSSLRQRTRRRCASR